MNEPSDTWRNERGRFNPGNPGGPGGSHKHATALRRAAEHAVTEEHVQAMVRKAVRMALEGNMTAMKVALERTIGRPAEAPAEARPLSIDIGQLRTAVDCSLATQRIVDGVVKGALPDAAAKLLLEAVQTRLKALELVEFEQRLMQLEETSKLVQRPR